LSTGQSTVFDLGTIAETFRHFEKLDIVIVGIGAIVPEVIAFDETEKRAGINGRTTTIAAVLVALALGGAATAKPLRTLAQGELRVGTYFVNPPFEYIARGARVGFEVNLMEEIARQLGLKPIFVNTRWETILKEMQDGRYDCIVGGITITPARERILAWSVPYVTTTLSLMMNSAKTPGICSLADMKGALVGVQAATTDYDAALAMQKRGQIGGIKVYPFDRIEEAMTDLAAGRITAVMKVAPVAAWLAAKGSYLRIVAQVPNDPQPLGIGFGKNQAALLAAVNGALASMRRDGRMNQLKEKWGVP
jgi:ABC-type amino acid transport substrate-binding protein